MEKNWGAHFIYFSECATLVPADLIAYSMTKQHFPISRGLAQLTKRHGRDRSIRCCGALSEGAEQFYRGWQQGKIKPKPK
ncbi:MAG: hypothetical protein R2825_10735 [Saprospiraceae bacterium]